MKTSVLLTLGRLPKSLELARSLHGAGCDVFIAEPFKNHLSKPSRAVKRSYQVTAPIIDQTTYLKELLTIIHDEKINLVVPVSEESLHVSLLAPHLPEHTRLLSASHEVLKRLHDKFAFAQTAKRHGLTVPETYRGDDENAQRLTAEKDYVAKPTHGCSGSGMTMHRRAEPLAKHYLSHTNILQERIFGREVSSLTLCDQGRILGGVLYEGTVYSGSVSTCFRRVDDAPAAQDWIKRFAAAEKFTGFVAFDFIIDENKTPWAIECNPRLTSGIHFFDHSDLAACLLGQSLGRPIRLKPEQTFQEGHTTLLEAYGRILHPKEFVTRIRQMLGARDVLWSISDPAPFFLMTPMSWEVLKKVMFENASFGEAATRDIEWREGDGAIKNLPLGDAMPKDLLQNT
ncbi:MAG: ATP-grasp domain-containing protein [Pseudomonadota bacterium]